MIVILGIMAGVALPRYFDHQARAKYAVVDAIVDAFKAGIGQANLALQTGLTSDTFTDTNSNGFVDDIGDLVATEPSLFDSILTTPVPNARGQGVGWKPYEVSGFPISGIFWIYFYDVDGSEAYESGPGWNEPILGYNAATGQVIYLPDSRAP